MATGNTIQPTSPMQPNLGTNLGSAKPMQSTFSGYNPSMQGISSSPAYSGSKGSVQPPATSFSQNYAMPNKTVNGMPVRDPYYEQFKTASAKEQQNYGSKYLAGQPAYMGAQQQSLAGPVTNIGGNYFSADMSGLPGNAMAGTGPLTNEYLNMPDPQTAFMYKNPAKPKDDEILKKQQMAYQQQMGYIQQPNSPMQFGNSPYTNQGYQGGTLLQLLGRLFGGF